MNDKPNALIKRRGPDRKLWVIVAHAVDMTTAAIPAGLLESAGMPVFLFREAIGSSALPLTVGKMGGVDVAVPEAYYEEALALLDPAGDDPFDELPPLHDSDHYGDHPAAEDDES
ncbi:MAG: DUF2007 domain-containing protein [Anaerolineae bacterium]|nr:DUF2007 domain-containing protein [Anaerolineae bacterium]